MYNSQTFPEKIPWERCLPIKPDVIITIRYLDQHSHHATGVLIKLNIVYFYVTGSNSDIMFIVI